MTTLKDILRDFAYEIKDNLPQDDSDEYIEEKLDELIEAITERIIG